MLIDIPSDAALALLRDLVAKGDAGIMLHAAHVSLAGELAKGAWRPQRTLSAG